MSKAFKSFKNKSINGRFDGCIPYLYPKLLRLSLAKQWRLRSGETSPPPVVSKVTGRQRLQPTNS